MDVTAFLNTITTPHLLLRAGPKNQDIPGKFAEKEGIVRVYIFHGHESVGHECTVMKRGEVLQHNFYFVEKGVLNHVSKQQFQELEALVSFGDFLNKLFDAFAAYHTLPQSLPLMGIQPEVLALLKNHGPTQKLLARNHITWEEDGPTSSVFTKHK